MLKFSSVSILILIASDISKAPNYPYCACLAAILSFLFAHVNKVIKIRTSGHDSGLGVWQSSVGRRTNQNAVFKRQHAFSSVKQRLKKNRANERLKLELKLLFRCGHRVLRKKSLNLLTLDVANFYSMCDQKIEALR